MKIKIMNFEVKDWFLNDITFLTRLKHGNCSLGFRSERLIFIPIDFSDVFKA